MKIGENLSSLHQIFPIGCSTMLVDRRKFLATSLASGAVLACPLTGFSETNPSDHSPFHPDFAPHLGMFQHHAGEDWAEQLEFIASVGFRTIEDTGLANRPLEIQQALGQKLSELNMKMGTFVACCDYGNPTFSSGNPHYQRKVLKEMETACEVAARTGAKYCTLIPGTRSNYISDEKQTENALQLLRRCTNIGESAGLTLLLEPLNHWPDSPKLFLHSAAQTADLCRKLNTPSCKLLFDIPHQATVTKDLFATLENVWDQVGYLQLGDDRGRKEPGTGNLDYPRLMQFIIRKQFTGPLGMDHGNSLPGKAGELAVLEAYENLLPS